jgi:hypothetical protein
MEALLREWRHDEELSEARRWSRPVRIPYEEAASRRAWSVFIGAHGLTAARTVCHDRSPPSHLGQGTDDRVISRHASWVRTGQASGHATGWRRLDRRPTRQTLAGKRDAAVIVSHQAGRVCASAISVAR